MKKEYDVIIGLEIHAELKTRSKMFCSCNNDSEGQEPNMNVCPVCLGHPGTLPFPNKQAIEDTILVGLGLHSKTNSVSKFDRKNYFYPDLPKGYQISQYDLPLVYGGHLLLDGERIEITRIHLEEDTGKSTHPAGKSYSLIDYNRAGTPLIEMVTEPVLINAAQVKKFCMAYQAILRYLDISNADMEKGEMRCEANISVQEKGRWKYVPDASSSGKGGAIVPEAGYALNPKVELKNINSFRAIEKAIDYEIGRQIKALEEGGQLVQETRGWDENRGKTVSQRTKESSADYRYFPEPDIPPMSIDGQWVEEIASRLIELPPEKKARFMEEYSLSDADAGLLVSDRALAAFTENTISELRAWIDSTGDDWERQKNKLSKLAANWLISELFKHLNADRKRISDIRITPENFAELLCLVYQDKINSSAGQQILEAMYAKGGDPTAIMQELGLEQLGDEDELGKVISGVLAECPNQAAEYRSGKTAVLQYLVGRVMAATRGKANPKKAAEILKKQLDS